MPLSFLCVNIVPSHQIIQLVNKNKFPWNCTLFKPSKQAAVSSVYAWWSPGGRGWWIYPPAGSAAGYLGAVWATGPVSILSTSWWCGEEFLYAFPHLTHKPEVSPVHILPWVSPSPMPLAWNQSLHLQIPTQNTEGTGPLTGENVYFLPSFVLSREVAKNVLFVYW